MAQADSRGSGGFLSIEIESFKAFRDRTRLELAPITLLYGRNQAGKSTLLRLLVWLADSAFGSAPVMDLMSLALGGATFKELGWLGPDPSASPIIKLENAKSKHYLEIQYTDDRGVVPNRIDIGTGDYSDFNVFAGQATRAAQEYRAPYEGAYGKDTWSGELSFTSLLPTGVPEHSARRLSSVAEALEPLRRIQWISGARWDGSQSRKERCCNHDGSDLPMLLQERRDVIERASDWLANVSGLNQTLAIGTDSSGKPRFELRGSGTEALPEYLAGEGARWLLPTLLIACWAELGGQDAPTMLAIEELEAKLHPNLQLSLFCKLLEVHLRTGIPLVLETHSIYLLRQVQLAAAKAEISPENVAIYWVEVERYAAKASRVEVNKDGTLVGWNPETFEEEQRLARELFMQRWKAI